MIWTWNDFSLAQIFMATISTNLDFVCLFSIIFLFPELVLVHGLLWQSATYIFYLYVFHTVLFSVGKSVDVFVLFMCDESWAYCLSQNVDTTVSATPPRRGICPNPSYLLLWVCHCRILFTTSPLLSILPLGCNNTEQGWEGCPVPTFIVSHSQRDTRTHTLNTCTVFLYCLICNRAEVFD